MACTFFFCIRMTQICDEQSTFDFYLTHCLMYHKFKYREITSIAISRISFSTNSRIIKDFNHHLARNILGLIPSNLSLVCLFSSSSAFVVLTLTPTFLALSFFSRASFYLPHLLLLVLIGFCRVDFDTNFLGLLPRSVRYEVVV